MPFDYEANLTAVTNALSQYNTTTSSPDLSSGLTTRVKNVFARDPRITPPRNLDLPAVFVMISNKEEDFAGLGATGPTGNRKSAQVTYDIFGVYIKDGATDSHSTLLTETYRFAENIEGVFQAELDLSNTALWCNPQSTNFAPALQNEGSLIKAFLVQLVAQYHFR